MDMQNANGTIFSANLGIKLPSGVRLEAKILLNIKPGKMLICCQFISHSTIHIEYNIHNYIMLGVNLMNYLLNLDAMHYYKTLKIS